MANDKILVLRGELNWAKIIGKPRPHTGNPKYDKGPYWSVDLTPDEKSRKLIKAAGIADKLREPDEKDTRTESFLSLKVLENKANGEKNTAPPIVDIQGQPWDDKLIGNGSVADLKVKVVDFGDTVGAYLQGVRILRHVTYEANAFEPLDEDDEFFAKAETAKKDRASAKSDTKPENLDDDLDDEIPF